jgi:CRP-like cAMP-binding protein
VARPTDPEFTVQLGQVPLFRGLPVSVLEHLRSQARTKGVATGKPFFREGERADHFFVLISGRVKLTQLTPEGQRVVLRILSAGDAFGGAGVFGDDAYPIGAEAVEPSVALRWTSAAMRQLMESEPRVAMNAVQFVAGRLHDLQRRHRQAMTERVERRVARAVVRLAREAGRTVDGGVEIDFRVSRQDIAEMTGTTLYTVSRLLSTWQEQGLLRSRRQRITVTNPGALVALADDLPGGLT